MKLIIFGKDPQQATIVLNSQYVSAYHAELIMLDNGDMYLTDKSTNGTYINGARMTPGKEVPVHRGDNIAFADVPINWNQIEEVRVPKNVKRVIGIGTNPLNQFVLEGMHVSRFHATIREMQDGKWYICDHSTNGTKVNGEKLVKNHYTPLKAGDEIVCAGVTIQNPIPNKPIIKYVGISLGVLSAVALLLICLLTWPWGSQNNPDELSKTTMLVAVGYHYEVTCGTLDLENFGIPTIVAEDEDGDMATYYKDTRRNRSYASKGHAFTGLGTGFFVGNEGYFVTNRHVVRPWEENTTGNLNDNGSLQTTQELVEDFYRREVLSAAMLSNPGLLAHIDQIKSKGVIDYIMVAPSGQYLDSKNMMNCVEVAVDEDQSIDLAIVKILTTFPATSNYVPYKRIKKNSNLKVGDKISTYGYSKGLVLLDIDKTTIQPHYAEGSISRVDNPYTYGFSAPVAQGASGSPIFDQRGNVVCVLNSGYTNTQGFNYGIRSEYLYRLLQKANIIK